ncbi:hypothetical protein GCM10010168_08110 [Actinoplanes ianthinogenes]|uniref:hypothetical protein n=1 Tax=Actinoplanes ianthinogenes TaxID=122358 RepID=UPI00166FADF8|nr:hypothetical protein [Actinoplanes ianthinogenes]GGQ94596.1 hypothetical protein GCM10010168_08110 [Actinoplanes ianthinogenes]
MTTAQDVEHLYRRPDWDCRVCGLPWPCATARAGLLHEYRAFPSLLRIYLSTQMYDALEDMAVTGEVTPLNLHERFLAWALS